MTAGTPPALRPADTLLRACSVAIVGASPQGAWPTTIFTNLRSAGYPGRVFLVNPRYGELWGQPCYPSLSALPEPAELLLLLLPTRLTVSALEEGAARGARAAIIYSTGFGEGNDPEGLARGATIRALCERTGLRVCGPNCMGALSVREHLVTYPVALLPFVRPGSVGVVSQSGGSIGAWVRASWERGIGFSYVISSGNELDLDLADYLAFLVQDPGTRVIVLFIEGIRRPAQFAAVAEIALAQRKPILVVKIGRTERARQQALSHTGALAGSDEVFDAACRRLGLVRCPTLDDLLETTLAFSAGRIPHGSRAAVVVNSGGMKGLLLDHLEDVALELARFSPATEAALRPKLPPDLRVENPLECGVAGFGDERGFLEIVRTIAEDEGVDLLALHGELSRTSDGRRSAEPWAGLAGATDKPLLAFSRITHSLTEEARGFQEAARLPFLQGITMTLRALRGLATYGERVRRGIAPLPPPRGPSADVQPEAIGRLLQAYDLPEPRGLLVRTPAEAAEAARQIGFPVALKVVSPGVLHKTEVGGVVVGLRSEDEVRREGEALLERVGLRAPGATITGLLVQEMVVGTEMIVGAREDPAWGPILVVGLAGVFVELLRDVSFRLLPVDAEEAHAMLRELRAYRVLEGYRGQPRRDLAALVSAITGMSRLFADYRLCLADLEVNPLMVLEEGKGVRAVDVRPIRRDPDARAPGS